MASFTTRPNLSNLQFRQVPNSELDLNGKTKILPGGQIRVVYDDETNQRGRIILEGPPESFSSLDPFIRANEDGELYKEYIDLENFSTTIYQENHGFLVGDVVGFEDETDGSGVYTKAIADGTYPGEPLGFVTEIINDDTFVLVQTGFVVFNIDSSHPNEYLLNLTPGKVYYLSKTNEGKIVINSPTEIGAIRKAMFLPVKDFVSGDTNRGWVLPYPPINIVGHLRGETITGNGVDTNFIPDEPHGFNTFDVKISCYRLNPPHSEVYVKSHKIDENNVEIIFTKPPKEGVQYRVLIGA